VTSDSLQPQLARVPLGDLAHELRTPLTLLCGAMDLLRDSRDGEDAQLMTQMHQSLWTMVRLLDNAVLYEELALGSVGVNPQELDIVRFCQQILAEVVPLDRQALVQTEWPGESLIVKLDRELLRTLIANLLTNALRFSAETQILQFRLQQDRHGLTLHIQDQGLGIPASDILLVWQPFFRGSNVGRYPGMGLGLTVARECAQLMHSQLSLESVVGQGSILTWFLPVVDRPENRDCP
jgi:signal transduction histidine kinase